jgi:DNA-directed RNA polymerase subunit E'/Rpb7
MLRLAAESGSIHPVAYAEVGVFEPNFRSIVKRELESIKGGGIQISLSFEIFKSQEGLIHEIRLFSLGVVGLIFLGGDLLLMEPL